METQAARNGKCSRMKTNTFGDNLFIFFWVPSLFLPPRSNNDHIVVILKHQLRSLRLQLTGHNYYDNESILVIRHIMGKNGIIKCTCSWVSLDFKVIVTEVTFHAELVDWC